MPPDECIVILYVYPPNCQAIVPFSVNYDGRNLRQIHRALKKTKKYDRVNETGKTQEQGGVMWMETYQYVSLRERPEQAVSAAEWFHSKWGVPIQAYLECMNTYLNKETEYGWYLCLNGEQIIGGLGVIENDFHDRKDLTPNVCAVYTEPDRRGQGVAGHLLNMVTEDLKSKGISPIYLVTDHTGFYEKYGWEFLCMVQGDGEPDMTRMYIHR